MAGCTTIAIGKEWRDRVRSMAKDAGTSQLKMLESLLTLATARTEATQVRPIGEVFDSIVGRMEEVRPESTTGASTGTFDGEGYMVPKALAPIIEPPVELTVAQSEIDAILDEVDEPVEVEEGDPLAVVKPLVTAAPGERDRDMVPTGCPACLRGAPRRGALHNCGRPNPELGSARVGI